MPFILLWFITTLLLLSSAVKYALAGILKWYVPSAKAKKDYSLEPTVSILLPCFNEGKVVYDTIASICSSQYPSDKLDVVAIDDCSTDESWEWIQKAASDFPSVRAMRNEQNVGKSTTVIRALHASRGEIVIGIDSDCTFAPNTVKELVVCFAEPNIGAVGGIVGVKNVNTNAITTAQTFVYYTQYHLSKVVENWTRTVVCLSGCLIAIKRSIFLEIAPMILDRNWLGIHVNEGEDRFLTHQILLRGYGTYLNHDAQCWTNVPDTYTKLFKQQLRWRRGSLRDFFMTVRSLPQHIRTVHLNAIYSMLLQPLAFISASALMLMAPFSNINFWLAPMMLIVYGTLSIIFHLVINKFNPEQRMNYPLHVAGFAGWMFASLFLTILAILTFDTSDWGTREKTMAEGI